jgi:hypothetical protein
MTGASYNKQTNKWISRIMNKKKHYYLGSYHTKEEAEAAYIKKKR